MPLLRDIPIHHQKRKLSFADDSETPGDISMAKVETSP